MFEISWGIYEKVAVVIAAGWFACFFGVLVMVWISDRLWERQRRRLEHNMPDVFPEEWTRATSSTRER